MGNYAPILDFINYNRCMNIFRTFTSERSVQFYQMTREVIVD